jgi:cytochrome c oxidase assembly protein Cox11
MVTAETSRAVKLFRFSIAYLFFLFIALGVDAAMSGGRLPAALDATVPVRALVPAPRLAAGPALLIRLSSHTMGELPVTAEPLVPEVTVRRGEVTEVRYRFVNPSPRAVEFRAGHRVTPQWAEPLFHEQPGFGIVRQKLAPGAESTLPVRFVVDPALPDSIHALDLDYALFELAPPPGPAAASR